MKLNTITTMFIAIGSLFAGGGIPKGVEFVKYEILGKAHDGKEALMRHLISDHLSVEEECKSTTLDAKEGFASITIRPDDCFVIKRKDRDGNIVVMDILPDPKKADRLKELYSSNNHGVVYAEELLFDFGKHKGGFDYGEGKVITKKGVIITRTYFDGCVLRYEFDSSGYAKNWKWIKYQHEK